MALYEKTIGQTLRLNLVDSNGDAFSVDGVSNPKLFLEVPSTGVEKEFTAIASGSSLSYVTETENDLPEGGVYKMQGYFEQGSWKGRTGTVVFRVYRFYE